MGRPATWKVARSGIDTRRGFAPSRRGVQVEITVSLAIVMVTATGMLAAFFLATHAAQTARLRPLLGRALTVEAARIGAGQQAVGPSARWFVLDQAEQSSLESPTPKDGLADLDAASRQLAAEVVREQRSLMSVGLPWEPIRFAAPVEGATGSEVIVAVLPPAVPRLAAFGLLFADVLAFSVLGSYLLRRRVVLPLRDLAEAARSIGEAGPGARVQVEGVGETVQVARAFNEMSEALETRTTALEKAVLELRSVNQRLQRARDGLDRAERMAAVGHLAAGVAHEVGNPMGAVLAFVDLAQRDAALSPEAQAHLSRAAEQGERVREILRQLLDFSRPPRAAATAVDLRAAAEQTVGLVQAQSRYRQVRFELRSDEAVAPALADHGLVAQILLNLVLNAADAALAGDPSVVRLTITSAAMAARAGDRSSGDRLLAADRKACDAVECRVEDSGPGVLEEDRERIFDPFFTTKPPGDGTGLGLANAMQLTQELTGVLEQGPSEDLGGAWFALRLPLAGSSEGGVMSVRTRRDDG
jgi:two-component system NtrC family sensor kinase